MKASLPLITLREIGMMQVMNLITEKENWESKAGRIHDPTSAFPQRGEVLQRAPGVRRRHQG